MPSYSEDWNPFPNLTPKFQLKVTRLAAVGCLLVLATTIGILAWIDSSRTYCPGWVFDQKTGTRIWEFALIWSLPVTTFWCWRAIFMTERKFLTEQKAKYEKGPPYNLGEDITYATPEEFRKIDFDEGICAGAVFCGLITAVPLFLMLALCSPPLHPLALRPRTAPRREPSP
ncbi:hypothetical protein [Xanthobacter versatilis]|uniref:hypothetical protein n=1 Tax=Xanthobacter autotrophicus (strain ATCC BAA-1158 / Py2) TaxID=78245 RepID=UPI0037296338